MTEPGDLPTRVHDLLGEAIRIYHDNPAARGWLYRQAERFAGPLRLAVTGTPGAGKSTLVSALVGQGVALSTDGEAGHRTWYSDGPQPRAQVRPLQRAPYELPLHRDDHGLRLIGVPGDALEILVEWPSRSLRHTHLLDTPGLTAADAGWQTAAELWQEVDAVLFLSRTLSAADLGRVPPVRGGWAAATAALHVIAVLSRADETVGGRVDAMLAAKQIARRRRREPDVTVMCQDALAVSGLVGYAARTLRQDEFDAVATLGTLPRPELEPYLLSVDRFRAAGDAVALPADRRERLLGRLGLTGIRLATTLVRSGAHDTAALAEALQRHSGLAELQAAVADLFSARRDVLKSRVALLAVEQIAHREPGPQSAYLLGQVERVVAGAHEFEELRLLAALRTRRAGLPGELAMEARRLAGGDGPTVFERLGVPPESPIEHLWEHAGAAAERWRHEAQQADPAGRRAAQVVLQSCEAMLQQLTEGVPTT
ncbi:GTPase domain-containing protein [Actinoplanes sp. NPDC049316]|uniref:GTPase domain-containing protein n=1 Tax=Actinoplanes sp. NPDC049316 TaxID=3154727 RepID=UPI00342BE5AC